MLVTKLQQRLRQEESGFTLIELLIVLVIIGILLAIAVPSYLGFKDRAEKKAAASNVRAAIPAAEAYYADWGNYDFDKLPGGGTATPDYAALKAIDQGIAAQATGTPLGEGLVVIGTGTNYCISARKGNKYAKVLGPGGQVDDTVTAHCTSATA